MNAFSHGNLNVAKDALRGALLDLEIATYGQSNEPRRPPREDLVAKARIDVERALKAIDNALELDAMAEGT